MKNAGDVQPLKAKNRYSPELIAETKEVWQPYYNHRLTDEDAREIIENIVAFMDVLAKIRDESIAEANSVQNGSR